MLYGFNHGRTDAEIVQYQPMLHCDMDLILTYLWAQIPELTVILLHKITIIESLEAKNCRPLL